MKQLPNLTRKEENFLALLLESVELGTKLKTYGSRKKMVIYKCDLVIMLDKQEYQFLKEIVKNITEK